MRAEINAEQEQSINVTHKFDTIFGKIDQLAEGKQMRQVPGLGELRLALQFTREAYDELPKQNSSFNLARVYLDALESKVSRPAFSGDHVDFVNSVYDDFVQLTRGARQLHIYLGQENGSAFKETVSSMAELVEQMNVRLDNVMQEAMGAALRRAFGD